MDLKNILSANKTLRESREHRDAIRLELDRMPAQLRSSVPYTDRVTELDATRRSVARLEDHLGAYAEEEPSTPRVASGVLAADDPSRFDLLDAFKEEGLLTLSVKPQYGPPNSATLLTQANQSSREFVCCINSSNQELGFRVDDRLRLTPAAYHAAEERAEQNLAAEEADAHLPSYLRAKPALEEEEESVALGV